MSVAEELRRLQRAADVNDGHLQRLQNELRLLDIAREAKRASSRQHTAQARAEIRRLEANIAAIEGRRRPVTAAHLVASPPVTPPAPSPAVPRGRLEGAVAALERQSAQLARLRAQRQELEELLRHAVAHYPQYKITENFDAQNEFERAALARVMNAA
ncbi:uncharacterized protein Tco025E_03703 [Trypanosoma conorhini]|uniref:Uncharacterized protein n=1 Tax=Trypanosoma conorhini TaxID=83891 RepID=A0A422PSF2_9TRYP|nr:uncharacterized protein Tco025E_03703 [Trypanosoma conorhini]RNF20676.1 hypothetical protein Tco025E_03703 [Trypanosoma conorhini]